MTCGEYVTSRVSRECRECIYLVSNLRSHQRRSYHISIGWFLDNARRLSGPCTMQQEEAVVAAVVAAISNTRNTTTSCNNKSSSNNSNRSPFWALGCRGGSGFELSGLFCDRKPQISLNASIPVRAGCHLTSAEGVDVRTCKRPYYLVMLNDLLPVSTYYLVPTPYPPLHAQPECRVE